MAAAASRSSPQISNPAETFSASIPPRFLDTNLAEGLEKIIDFASEVIQRIGTKPQNSEIKKFCDEFPNIKDKLVEHLLKMGDNPEVKQSLVNLSNLLTYGSTEVKEIKNEDEVVIQNIRSFFTTLHEICCLVVTRFTTDMQEQVINQIGMAQVIALAKVTDEQKEEFLLGRIDAYVSSLKDKGEKQVASIRIENTILDIFRLIKPNVEEPKMFVSLIKPLIQFEIAKIENIPEFEQSLEKAFPAARPVYKTLAQASKEVRSTPQPEKRRVRPFPEPLSFWGKASMSVHAIALSHLILKYLPTASRIYIDQAPIYYTSLAILAPLVYSSLNFFRVQVGLQFAKRNFSFLVRSSATTITSISLSAFVSALTVRTLQNIGTLGSESTFLIYTAYTVTTVAGFIFTMRCLRDWRRMDLN